MYIVRVPKIQVSDERFAADTLRAREAPLPVSLEGPQVHLRQFYCVNSVPNRLGGTHGAHTMSRILPTSQKSIQKERDRYYYTKDSDDTVHLLFYDSHFPARYGREHEILCSLCKYRYSSVLPVHSKPFCKNSSHVSHGGVLRIRLPPAVRGPGFRIYSQFIRLNCSESVHPLISSA